MCILTTVGATLLIFYQSNADLVTYGWIILGLPKFGYFVTNVNEACFQKLFDNYSSDQCTTKLWNLPKQTNRFPDITHGTVALISGLFDLSGGIFVFIKMIYDSGLGIRLVSEPNLLLANQIAVYNIQYISLNFLKPF